MARTCETLTIDEIVEINRRALEVYGGLPFAGINNLKEQGSLEYILEAITGEVFGVELFPSIEQKAAALGWRIMAGHIFHDANKRTGSLACSTFLFVNGYDLRIDFDKADDDVLEICTGVADNKITEDEFTVWVKERMIPFDLAPYE